MHSNHVRTNILKQGKQNEQNKITKHEDLCIDLLHNKTINRIKFGIDRA